MSELFKDPAASFKDPAGIADSIFSQKERAPSSPRRRRKPRSHPIEELKAQLDLLRADQCRTNDLLVEIAKNLGDRILGLESEIRGFMLGVRHNPAPSVAAPAPVVGNVRAGAQAFRPNVVPAPQRPPGGAKDPLGLVHAPAMQGTRPQKGVEKPPLQEPKEGMDIRGEGLGEVMSLRDNGL